MHNWLSPDLPGRASVGPPAVLYICFWRSELVDELKAAIAGSHSGEFDQY